MYLGLLNTGIAQEFLVCTCRQCECPTPIYHTVWLSLNVYWPETQLTGQSTNNWTFIWLFTGHKGLSILDSFPGPHLVWLTCPWVDILQRCKSEIFLTGISGSVVIIFKSSELEVDLYIQLTLNTFVFLREGPTD